MLSINPVGERLEKLAPLRLVDIGDLSIHENHSNTFSYASMAVACRMATVVGCRKDLPLLLVINKYLMHSFIVAIERGDIKELTYSVASDILNNTLNTLLDDIDFYSKDYCMYVSNVIKVLSTKDPNKLLNVNTFKQELDELGEGEAMIHKFFDVCLTSICLSNSLLVDIEDGRKNPSRETIATASSLIGSFAEVTCSALLSGFVRAFSIPKEEVSSVSVWDSMFYPDKMLAKLIDVEKAIVDNKDLSPKEIRDKRVTAELPSHSLEDEVFKEKVFSLTNYHRKEKESAQLALKKVFDIHYKALTSMVRDFLSQCRVFIFSKDDLKSNLSDGQKFTTFWDLYREGMLESTWHSNFSDTPHVARTNNELRLFGEIGDNITYGCIIHPEDEDSIEALKGMYGEHYITLPLGINSTVRNCSSITLGDSSLSAKAYPLSEKNLIALAAISIAYKVKTLQELARALHLTILGSSYNADACSDFIEIQIHKRITKDDLTD